MPTILTNKYNLPDPIVEACKNDSYVAVGDISITQLIDSPRIRMLKKLNTIEEDVTDRLWMLFGSAMHGVLEKNVESKRIKDALSILNTFLMKRSVDPDDDISRGMNWLTFVVNSLVDERNERYMCEKRYTVEVNGWTISGQIDLYDKQELKLPDYKMCKVYKWTNPESRKSWIRQLNGYAWLLHKNGIPVNKLEIIPFFRDWSKGNLLRLKSSGYPPEQTMVIPIDLWPMDRIEQWFYDRVLLHQQAQYTEIPECTGEERWAKSADYAVRQEDSKSTKALRTFQTEGEANNWIANNQYKFGKKLYFEHRVGTSGRCSGGYCPVSEYCDQWKKIQSKSTDEDQTF